LLNKLELKKKQVRIYLSKVTKANEVEKDIQAQQKDSIEVRVCGKVHSKYSYELSGQVKEITLHEV